MRSVQSDLIAWVERGVLDEAISLADAVSPNETGGVLMGYWSTNPESVVVTNLVGPGPHAIHKADSFAPDHDFQDGEVARLYKESGRIVTYLGDWHSHPRGPLELSLTDRITQLRIAAHRKARAPRAIMGILAGGPKWNLGVWSFSVRFGFPTARAMVVRTFTTPA